MNTVIHILSRIRLAGIIFIILLAGCTSSPEPTPTAALEQVSLKLNWEHTTQFLGFYVAQEKGYYAEEGLEVTIAALEEGEAAAANQVAAGEYDFGVGAQDLVTGQSNTLPLTAFAAIYKFSPVTLFARSDSGIVTPADLKGHTVVVKSNGWQSFIEALLDHGGLTLDDIIAVSGRYDMTPFLEDEVDVWAGFLTNEVVLARMAGLDLVTFPLYEYGISTPSMVIFATQETLENRPEITRRFLRASLRGWQWALDNHVEAVDIMLALFPELADEREFHIASFQAAIPLILHPEMQLGEIDCEAWEAHQVLAGLESTEGLCTTEIFDAINEIN